MTLVVLPPGESVALLAELVGRSRVEAEPSMALRIAQLCGYLPLALRVVGERASGRPALSLAELADELIGEQARLDALALAEDELSDTRAVFSWSYRALAPELQRAFRHLGLHAGPEIGPDAAAALIGVDVPTARRQLRALTEVHLIQEVFTNRFSMHDLLRSYACERAAAEDAQAERTQAIRRVLTWYLLTTDIGRRAILPHSVAVPLVPGRGIEITVRFDDSAQAMHWLDMHHANLLQALRQATEHGHLDIVWKLAITVSGYLELRGYWTEWEETIRAGLAAAQTLGDSFGETASLLLLADASWRKGNLEEAAEQYRQSAALAHEIPVGWLEGFALRGLGLILGEQGHHSQARGLFEQALDVFRAADHRRGEGMSLLSLGNCARSLGDPAGAVAYGSQALDILEGIGDAWTVAWGKLALASSLPDAGRHDEAVTYLNQSLEAFRAYRDVRSEAQTLLTLGDVCQALGRPEEAHAHWVLAADLYETLGDAEHHAQVRERLAGVDGQDN